MARAVGFMTVLTRMIPPFFVNRAVAVALMREKYACPLSDKNRAKTLNGCGIEADCASDKLLARRHRCSLSKRLPGRKKYNSPA